jgi:molecular chaperone HtpG
MGIFVVTTSIDAPDAQSHAFQADVSRLLHLMVHSIYSDRDIFLRELISNGADACEKLRYEALANPALIGEEAPFAIELTLDKEAGTLTVSDNGVGMGRTDLVEALGTIANSGTRAFLERISASAEKKGDQESEEEGGAGRSGADLIGQFGRLGEDRDAIARHRQEAPVHGGTNVIAVDGANGDLTTDQKTQNGLVTGQEK